VEGVEEEKKRWEVKFSFVFFLLCQTFWQQYSYDGQEMEGDANCEVREPHWGWQSNCEQDWDVDFSYGQHHHGGPSVGAAGGLW